MSTTARRLFSNLSFMSQQVKDRLRHVREAMGMNKNQFAKLIGVTRATVSQWETGNIKTLKTETLLRIEDKTEFSLRWVFAGIGPRKIQEPMSQHILELARLISGLPPELLEKAKTYVTSGSAERRIIQHTYSGVDRRRGSWSHEIGAGKVQQPKKKGG